MNNKTQAANWRFIPAARFSAAAVIFSTLLLLGVWATVSTMLIWQWKDSLDAEMRQNTNIAKALKEHTLRIIKSADQAMWRVQEIVNERPLTGADLVAIAKETGMAPQILTQLAFVSANGVFQWSNLDPDGTHSKYINLMDRDHIRVHLLPPPANLSLSQMLHDGLFIGKSLVGKVSQLRTIQLSRKLIATNGSTLGVIVASLNPSHFALAYGMAEMGNNGGATLTGFDGVIRVQVVDGETRDVGMQATPRLVQAMQSQSSGAMKLSSYDGVARIVGFSQVGDYPLAVACGTSVKQALDTWSLTRNYVVVLTVLLTVAVVAFVSVFLRSIHHLTISHDALTKSEAAAQQSNQAKSTFLAAMSHELRTPLTSILGYSELMEKRSSEPLIKSQSQTIRKAAEHLNSLLTEILDLSRVESGSMPIHHEPVDLRDLARDVSELFRASAQAKSLSLTTTIASDVPLTLFTDRFRLKQILNNLLSNAIKFTLSGAVELAIKPSPEGSHVLFHVIDTGPGIAPAKHEIVFEKFSQANARISYQHGGTGLGLSLSRGLAQLLGGTLNVESSLGKGSKFTLSLPCHGAFHG